MQSLFKSLLVVVLLLSVVPAEAACRSAKLKRIFNSLHGYPNGRKGYVIDHLCALAKCNGTDTLHNLQYQTIEEAKAKDKWESTPAGCKKTCDSTNSLSYRTVYNCN